MNKIVYVKIAENEDDVLINNHPKLPMWIKKLIFIYKNIFNIITKKQIEKFEIWVLPIQENKYSNRKIKNLFQKFGQENKYVLPESLKENKTVKNANIPIITGTILNKVLTLKTLEYIANIQNRAINSIDLTILVNKTSELNMYLIELLSKTVKNVKIVSDNLFKFKKLEEKLYEEYGIAIQFSKSFQKSLAKSEIILNLDFSETDINDYVLYSKAIILNCAEEKIKIKSKLFSGILINSYQIKFKKELEDKFRKSNLYCQYTPFMLYESLLNKERNDYHYFDKIEEDEITIHNLIGSNGIINKKELKSLRKREKISYAKG